MSPTRLDIWLAARLADFLGRFPLFDRGVESAIRHNVLGGFWYAAALFVFWARGAKAGQEHLRTRILTTLVGSFLTILLTLVAGVVVSWPPPIGYPGLSGLYPEYLGGNPNAHSFPSQSTALYAAVAAGVYSMNKSAGWILWSGLGVLVALPRIYVGGHYLSDVIAGAVLGLAGYAGARWLFEPEVIRRVQLGEQQGGRLRLLGEILVFAWVLEVAVEFRDVAWLAYSLKYLMARALGS